MSPLQRQPNNAIQKLSPPTTVTAKRGGGGLTPKGAARHAGPQSVHTIVVEDDVRGVIVTESYVIP